MLSTSIIQRRDLEPLWVRANAMAKHYEKAGNCITAVMGADFVSVNFSNHPKAFLFCSVCRRYYKDAGTMSTVETPCSAMHHDAVKEARKLGGSFIYTCPIGFYFWTSPFFSGERFAGAFMSSGFLAIKRKQVQDKIFNICKGEISRLEIDTYLEGLPERKSDDVKAHAQMLLLCAEKISSSRSHWDDLTEHDYDKDSADCQPHLRDKERQLIACLRRGDNSEAQVIARALLGSFYNSADDNFEILKMKTIELVVLLSRTGTNSENEEEFLEANSRNLKRIEDSKNAGELADNLCLAIERMTGIFFSFQGMRHASALRKAERYIWENYTRKLSLKEIADVSGLSAPYFSTIFKDEMGENLSNYLNRLRVEKSLVMLRETENPINRISAACGFEDQSWFSKIFKSYTGISPYEYRKHGGTVLSEREGQGKKA
jgi:AraC-like DNA-binding protein/ligand-binding sensor protein